MKSQSYSGSHTIGLKGLTLSFEDYEDMECSTKLHILVDYYYEPEERGNEWTPPSAEYLEIEAVKLLQPAKFISLDKEAELLLNEGMEVLQHIPKWQLGVIHSSLISDMKAIYDDSFDIQDCDDFYYDGPD